MRAVSAIQPGSGRRRASVLAARFGAELRIARAAAGLTQRQLGRIAGCSQQAVSRAERGAIDVSLTARCQMAAGCGFELGWKLYPVASVRLRDSGQLGLARAIAGQAHRSARVRMEVPVAPRDPRAADLVIEFADETLPIEIERSLVDLQAQLRAGQLKRDALAEHEPRPIRLILALPDTRATRRVLREMRDLLERTMPARSRDVWTAIRAGRPVGRDGVLLVEAGDRPRTRTA